MSPRGLPIAVLTKYYPSKHHATPRIVHLHGLQKAEYNLHMMVDLMQISLGIVAGSVMQT